MKPLPAIFISHSMPAMDLNPGPNSRLRRSLRPLAGNNGTTVTAGDDASLTNDRRQIPETNRNHPYPAEPFLPLLVAAGAGTNPSGAAMRLQRHFEYGELSPAARLGVEFGLLVPVGLAHKLWYDGLCFSGGGMALYFLIARVGYSVKVNAS